MHMQANQFELSAFQHPFLSEGAVRGARPEGTTVLDLVREAGIEPKFMLDVQVTISMGGKVSVVPMCHWALVKPKCGSHVLVTPKVNGALAGLVLGALLPSAAGYVAGTVFGLAVGTLGYALTYAAVTIVGSLLINALIPPPSAPESPKQDDPNYAITGSGNAENRYGVYPVVLGRHRMFPPKTARGYTEGEGADIYFRGRYTFGYGPVALETLKIGTTPITDFDGVEIEFLNVDRDETLKHMPDLAPLVRIVDGENLQPSRLFNALNDVYEIPLRSVVGSVDLKFEWSGAGSLGLDVQSRVSGGNWQSEATLTNEVDWSSPIWSDGISRDLRLVVSSLEEPVLTPGSGVFGLLTIRRKVSLTEVNTKFQPGYETGGWRQGSDVIKLYPDDIAEDGYSVRLDQDVAVVRSTRGRASSAEIDVTYQGLVKFSSENKKLYRKVEVGFRYRKLGDVNWIDAGVEGHRGRSTASLRFTKTIRFPVEGEYEIEVTRLTDDSEKTTVRDDSFLSAVRSVQAGKLPSHEAIAEVAVRIKASEQLNGQLQTLNAVVHQMAPVWDGASWSALQPVRHPAWIFARALMGPMLRKPLAEHRIQLADLLAWAEEEPHWTCDAVVEQSTTVAEVLDLISATGRARRSLRDLKFSVIRDGGAGHIVQQFNPRNSWGFNGRITFPKEIHGFRVRCLSERLDWQQDEITVYADGHDATTATEFETLELRGVVLSENEGSAGNAWRLGRYHLAQAVLRPEEFTWHSDLDHIRVNMGDKIRLVHDVPLIGVGSGRVTSVLGNDDGELTGVILDEFLSPEGGSFRICVRRASGVEVVFEASPPTSYAGVWSVIDQVEVNDIEIGDLVSVEEVTQESMEVLVTSILHDDDEKATLRGVPAAPAVLDADKGEIPPYEPIITNVVPNDRLAPLAPVILSADTQNEIRENAAGDRSIAVFADLSWKPGAAMSAEGFLVFLTTPDGVRSLVDQTPNTSGRYLLSELGRYKFEVLARNAAGVSGAAVEYLDRTVVSETPDQVTGLVSQVSGDRLHLKWDAGKAIVSHFHLRYIAPEASGGWQQSALIDNKIPVNQLVLPALPGRYLIKAVSLFGRESVTATALIVESAGLSDFNVVEVLNQHPAFAGQKTEGLETVGDALMLVSDTPISAWPSLEGVAHIGGSGGIEPQGIYDFAEVLDLGEVYPSRVTMDVRGFGYRMDNSIGSWESLSQVESLSGVGSGSWSIEVQISTTQDDPHAAGAAWSEWSELLISDYVARGLKFRLIIRSETPKVAVRVDHASVTVDMPDRVTGGDDLVCPPDGVYVPFHPPFKVRPAIAVDGQELPSGARSVRSNATREGFHQQFVDASGAGVACSFDWVAKGYGRAQ